MLAAEYGYWISDGPARETPATAEWLRHRIDHHEQTRRRRNRAALVAVALDFGLGVYLTLEDLVFLVPFCFPLLVGILAVTTRGREQHAILVRELTVGPWQAWPCLLDGPKPVGPMEIRATVTLLDRGRNPVARYRGTVGSATWHRMEDGYGVLWVCGDLRSGVWVADPGGEPVWFMKPAPRQTQVSAPTAPGLGTAAADAAVREASAAVTRSWLRSLGM